ncbi:MAG TPA: hypothetical protein GXX40_02755 [Firmicutes bacterium]|nr:hypothetical protein [Bacillota bacterium]
MIFECTEPDLVGRAADDVADQAAFRQRGIISEIDPRTAPDAENIAGANLLGEDRRVAGGEGSDDDPTTGNTSMDRNLFGDLSI